MERKLPKDFYWGGSVSSFQTEGHRNEGGKGLCVYDVRPMNPEFSDWNDAIDEYTRYDEDIALMKGMGFNFYRFSICWSRIIPNGTLDEPVNEEGVKFYSDLIDKLLAAGIEPMITLVHFDMPYHLVKEYNGFASRYVVDCFERFAKVCFERYKDKVKYWMTFNEINNQMDTDNPLFFWTNSGVIVKEGEDPKAVLYKVAHNELLASAKAVIAGKEINPDFKIGCMVSHVPIYPYSCNPDDIMAAEEAMRQRYFFADVHCRGHYPSYALKEFERKGYDIGMEEGDAEILAKGTVDYIGFSYYMSTTVKADVNNDNTGDIVNGALSNGVENPYIESSDWGWAIDPVGLRYTLNRFYDRYELPLFIVENGFGAIDQISEDGQIHDQYRIDYLKKHIEQMELAVNYDGVDLMGYTPWGIMDLVSFTTGEMKKRYGMIYVDRDNEGNGTMERCCKDSYYWYKQVIKSQGENLEFNPEKVEVFA